MTRGKATTAILATIFLVMLSLSIVSAQNDGNQFTVKVREVASEVEPGGEAIFDLIITNNQVTEDAVSIRYDELKVFPFSDFAGVITTTPSELKLGAKETGTIRVKMRILDTAQENAYHEFELRAQSSTSKDSKVIVPIKIFVISSKGIISIEPKIPDNIVPGRSTPFKVSLRNKGNALLDDLQVYVTSELFSDSRIVTIEPGEVKEMDFAFNIPPGTKADEYSLNIRAYIEQRLKGEFIGQFTVIENPFVNEQKEVVKGFLTQTLKITDTNIGNQAIERKVIIPLSLWQRIFTSSDPKPVVEDGKLTWSFLLEPGKEQVINIRTDYRIPAVIILIIAAFIGVVIYMLSKGVTIKKRIFKVKTDEEEEEAELKILLHVRNKKDHEIKDVRVIDIIPNMVIPTKEFGTLKPTRVQKGNAGIRLIWEIPSLESGEERIISYKVRTKLQVFGKLELPHSSVQYTDEKGDIISVHSNRAGITE